MPPRVLANCLEDGLGLHPSGTALEGESGRLSYADLAERAAGLGLPEAIRVALWAEKTVDAIAALIGIHRAGHACIPVDPLNPPERAVRILEDSGAGMLLTQRSMPKPVHALIRERLPGLPLVDLAEAFSGRKNGTRSASPEDIAYILYTSGSTGIPKGVMISHRAAMTFIDWARPTFALGTEDRVASLAPLHFDLSLFDVYATLSAGATIVPCGRALLSFPESLLDWIRSERITTLYATPTLLAALVNHGISGRLSGVKRILFAGEVMPAGILAGLMEGAPRASFHNLYGPTETNVCTAYEVKRPPSREEPIPIGYPCEYNRVDIVREDGSQASPGEIGEIRVDGPNLMSGYRSGPAQAGPYLTGDLGFVDGSGLLHFRGRRDGMFKVRGYRVEPGEIEASLGAHPDVLQAAAFKTVDASGLEIVASAVVMRKESAAGEAELRRHCGLFLPSYMIPSRIEIRERLPVNAHGKVDRAALSGGAKR